MIDPRQAIFDAVRAADPAVFDHPTDGPMRIGALNSLLDALGIARAGQGSKPKPTSQSAGGDNRAI